jgi:hypothetical protein
MPPSHRIIDLPKISDTRGNLTFAQNPDHIPFMPRRMFMLYGMPADAERGDHAHRLQHQYLVMMHGTGTIEVDNGSAKAEVTLDTPSRALYAPPMLWLRLRFGQDAVCAVLTSDVYAESDYIRDYKEFLSLAGKAL